MRVTLSNDGEIVEDELASPLIAVVGSCTAEGTVPVSGS